MPANTLGTLAGALVLQRALELVFTVRPILRNICLNLRDLDTGASEAKFNQTVYTRTISIPTVQDFGTGGAGTNDTDVPTVLDKFKEVHYAFTVQEYSATDRDLVTEHAMPMAIAIANHMVDAIAAKWTAANFANKTVKAAGWDYEHLTIVRKALQDRGVPPMSRFYAANSSVYQSMLNDQVVVTALNNPDNGRAISTGRLPRVSDFGIEEYPALPNNGEGLVAFAGTPDAVVMAQRVPRNPEELLPGTNYPGNIGVVTEPRTGLSVMVTQWIAADTLTANNRLIWMYGTAVGNANNGQRIATA